MVGSVARRSLALDVALLLAAPLLLGAVHVLAPPAVHRALAFDHARFDGYTLLTAAYVHASDGHLLRNLVGYALAALYAYALCLGAGERRWFRRTLSGLLLALPVPVSLTSYVVFARHFPASTPTSRGFSGVVAGVGGFLLVALYVFVAKRHGDRLGTAVALSVLLSLLQSIDFRYTGGFRPSVTGPVVLGGLVAFAPVIRDGVGLPSGADRRDAAVSAGLVGLVGVVLGVLVLALFPRPGVLASDGTFTNVFAHGAGFGWGAALAATTRAVSTRAARR